MKKVLSLGAGVQSTTVLLMSCLGELERPDFAVFADTGWEPMAVYRHLGWLEHFAEKHGIKVHRVSSGKNIKINEMEQAKIPGKTGKQSGTSIPIFTASDNSTHGMLRRSCTGNYKITPLEHFVRKQVEIPRKPRNGAIPLVEQWFGISTDERQRMRLSPRWWSTYYYPLIDIGMSRSDCLAWLDTNGFSRPPRSACIGCPFKSDSEWRWLKDNSPTEWEDACQFDEAMRVNARLRNPAYLHRSLLPLREVDLSAPEDHGQLNLWGVECAGMCGV